MSTASRRRFLGSGASGLVLAGILLFASTVSAQVDTGTILGTVRDGTGAVIPGVAISLTNEDTKVTQTGVTDERGNYLFAALRVGSYALTAELQGFKKVLHEHLTLNIQQRLALDLTMEVGGLEQVVDVTGAAPVLQTQDASVGLVVQTQMINDLPLVARNYTFLAQLNPGVVQSQQDNRGLTASGSFAANGQDSFQNNYLLDGVDNNSNLSDYLNGSAYVYRPSVDALQEFKVQTSSYSAEFGRAAGAILNASLRSGSERFGGTLFEFYRNDALNAANFFDKANGLPKGVFKRNQFGGAIGGPLSFLTRGNSKTFFFTDYEGTEVRQATTRILVTPTVLMQQSNFTDLSDLITMQLGTQRDLLGRTSPLGQVFDPATTRRVTTGQVDPVTGLVATGTGFVRDPFPGNRIPANRINQNALKLLQEFPLPTRTDIFAGNYVVNPITNDDNHQGDVRIDHTIGQNDTIFGRASYAKSATMVPAPYPGIIDGTDFGGGDQEVTTHSEAISWTHVTSSTLLTEFRLGYSGLDMSRLQYFVDDTTIPAPYGLVTPQVPLFGGLPTFTVSGIGQFGAARWHPSVETQNTWQFSSVTTKVGGDHVHKFGFQYQRPNTTFFQPRAARGAYFYQGQYTDVPGSTTGNTGIAQMLLDPIRATVPGGFDYVGGPNRIEADNIPDPVPTNTWAIYAGFYEDAWRTTSKLTLTLGLRYDYVKNADAVDGYGAQFLYEPYPRYVMAKGQCNQNLSPSFLALAAADQIKIECDDDNHMVQSPKNMFSPRFGAAYQFHPKWVARAGFGVFYMTSTSGNIIRVVNQNYPFSYSVNLVPNNNVSTPIIYGDGTRATFESGIVPINVQDPTKFDASNLQMSGIPSPRKYPYSMQYNVTIQTELTPSQTVSVAYVGSQGRDGDIGYSFNAPKVMLPPNLNQKQFIEFPSFATGGMSTTLTGAKSEYNSAQFAYQKRFRSGLSALANYTLSKCRSQSRQRLVNTIGGYRSLWLLGPDWSLCAADATHLFNASVGFDLPFGQGRAILGDATGLLNQVVSGWRLNVIGNYSSGQPFTIGCTIATTTGHGCNALLTGEPLYPKNRNADQWLNPAAFTNPPVATAVGQTDLSPLGGPATQVRGPDFRKVDLSIFKSFIVNGNSRVEFRAEVFNVTNTPNFGLPGFSGGGSPPPSGVLDFNNLAVFGRITSLRLGANDSRQFQLALKYYF
jgi:Carboxypeptidase regulatory-like domain/TonB dependent receptor-like, beta-barrel